MGKRKGSVSPSHRQQLYFMRMLDQNGGNLDATAKMVNITSRTLRKYRTNCWNEYKNRKDEIKAETRLDVSARKLNMSAEMSLKTKQIDGVFNLGIERMTERLTENGHYTNKLGRVVYDISIHELTELIKELAPYLAEKNMAAGLIDPEDNPLAKHTVFVQTVINRAYRLEKKNDDDKVITIPADEVK